ncbi:hypothetical protein BP6252_05885 [Coleophoma cylindrospora]|uniref:NAD-dependent epimerase/dehydratase domain-containing protein n=1 Tax=Coleophoma cylindrospora TaxID=1849047 RepID=A0A3D8RUT6_9HELO|nr:hypothetical protein BP6252_05885 [Coleophoma cylindrospora]
MKVLLLGITGNVGSRLAPALIAHKHQVVAYVRPSSKNKIDPVLAKQLLAIHEGDATETDAIKHAILANDCSAVVNTAGLAAITPLSSSTGLPQIFAAVVAATVAAHQARGKDSPPIRLWMLSGATILDNPFKPGKQLGDSVPLFPEHRVNWKLIEKTNKEDVSWSLMCPSNMVPEPTPMSLEERRGNLVAGADKPPAWRRTWLDRIPVLGGFLGVAAQMAAYEIPLEGCADFLASDLEKGLNSEYIGHRVSLKVTARSS